MTDELRTLAEAARREHDWYEADQGADFNAYFALFPEDERYIAAASPDAILALLARIDTLQAERDKAVTATISATNEAARWLHKLDEAIYERDLAREHDRQPYPTVAAYEAACVALDQHRERADQAEAQLARLRDPERLAAALHLLRSWEWLKLSDAEQAAAILAKLP